MWARIKAACLHSLTIAFGYIQIAAAMFAIYADQVISIAGRIAGDPELVGKVQQYTPPRWGLVGVLGGITILCRLRSLLKGG